MKKQLLLLFLLTVTFGYAQELLVVDLTVENQITITATDGLSAATVGGTDTTGFYLADFFVNAGTQTLIETLVSGILTVAGTTSDTSPDLFRGTGIDTGLNIWSYTNDPTSPFTAGQLAFTGQATWNLSASEYNAMLTAPTSGNIFFPADTSDDLATAVLIGTYSVDLPPLSLAELQSEGFEYYPNPVRDILNISAQKVIVQVDIYNMLGQYVSVQKLNAVNGTVNTLSLAKGTYFFKATFQDGTTGTLKVIKN